MVDDSIRTADLFKIARLYFERRYPGQFKMDVSFKGRSKTWNFDFLLETRNGEKFGIVVKDWIRTLGVNQVRQVQKACLDLGLDGGVLVSNSFSPSAKSFGERYGISCFSRYELLDKI